MAALDTSVSDTERRRFVSLRLTLAKIVLTAGGLLGGLAIGREGPSVQIAAGVMLHARALAARGAPRSPRTACWWPAARPASRPPSTRRWPA